MAVQQNGPILCELLEWSLSVSLSCRTCGRYVNARQEEGEMVNLLYSTPSCYLKALHDSGITWPAFQVGHSLQ